MKKLSLYAMVVSILITLMYSAKVFWLASTDADVIRMSLGTLVSEIGLWCAYYYTRDYEACKAHEEHAKRVASHFMMMASSTKDEEPQEKQ